MYLVRDWTNTPAGGRPNSFVVENDVELFEVIDKAKKYGYKIAVFKIGYCLVDWS